MRCKNIYIVLLVKVLLFSALAVAMESQVLLGPTLHFDSQNLKDKTWNVSALYLLTSDSLPEVNIGVGDKKAAVGGRKIASRLGRDYVKYSFTIQQNDKEQVIKYGLPGDVDYDFVVPAIGQPTNILYHSCNGYQHEHDRLEVKSIEPMWAQINKTHQKKSFHLQLGGGDQLYADGLTTSPGTSFFEPTVAHGVHGVFALPTLQPWIKKATERSIFPVSPDMADEIEIFYFNQYKNHYRQTQFRKAMASIPIRAQADDHDHYDGFKSLRDYIQQSFVINHIDWIAQWFVHTWQHALSPEEFLKNTTDKTTHVFEPYNFILPVSDGLVYIAGIDTRTERTLLQVVSDDTWDLLFNRFNNEIDVRCKHLLVMLAIPVVYPSSAKIDRLIAKAQASRLSDAFLSVVPGIKNAFGHVEMEDDLHDGWGHKTHVPERDAIVSRFQKLAKEKGIRVTFLGGDVHLGGVGKIYDRSLGFYDDGPSSIYQLISSPVGNIPVGHFVANQIGKKGAKEQSVGKDSAMKLFPLNHKDAPFHERNTSNLISARNFGMLQLDEKDNLQFTLSAETHEGIKSWSLTKQRFKREVPHRHYSLLIPPIRVH